MSLRDEEAQRRRQDRVEPAAQPLTYRGAGRAGEKKHLTLGICSDRFSCLRLLLSLAPISLVAI